MTEQTGDQSPRTKARIAGVFYLLTILTGAFALVVNGPLRAAMLLGSTGCYIAVTVLFYGLFFTCGSVRVLVGVLPPGAKAQRGSAIYFRVRDIDTVFSSLSTAGVRFTANPHLVNRTPRSELWLAEFTDPDGNQLALMSDVAVGGA